MHNPIYIVAVWKITQHYLTEPDAYKKQSRKSTLILRQQEKKNWATD